MEEAKTTQGTVCFQPSSDVTIYIERRLDVSHDQRKRCYYSKAELQIIQNRCFRDAEQLDSSSRWDRQACRRGLEGLSGKGEESLTAAINACIDAVIEEQEIQRYSDECDDCDRLAIASQKVSQQSINEARERAIQDEKEARNIYRQDQQKLIPPSLPIRRGSKELIDCIEHVVNFFDAEDDSQLARIDPMPRSAIPTPSRARAA